MSNLPASVLLDTNVLVRAAVLNDPLRSIAIAAISTLESSGSAIYVCPQNMQEFRQVATRPAIANGLGWSSADAAHAISAFEQRFVGAPETPALYAVWRFSVEGSSASGRANYDGRLMAVARSSAIDAILSFESGSFAKFLPFAPGITLLNPNTI